MRGRFWGENKRLIFAPPLWYDWLVISVTAGGLIAALVGWSGNVPMLYPSWWLFTGLAVFVAGVLALLSSERMTIDLRQRVYWRREGQGPFKRLTRGSIQEIDALVLQASEYPAPSMNGRLIVYRLVFYWKNNKEPLLITERHEASVGFMQPLNSGAAPLAQRGVRYAKEMNIPFFDNAHINTPDPQRIL